MRNAPTPRRAGAKALRCHETRLAGIQVVGPRHQHPPQHGAVPASSGRLLPAAGITLANGPRLRSNGVQHDPMRSEAAERFCRRTIRMLIRSGRRGKRPPTSQRNTRQGGGPSSPFRARPGAWPRRISVRLAIGPLPPARAAGGRIARKSPHKTSVPRGFGLERNSGSEPSSSSSVRPCPAAAVRERNPNSQAEEKVFRSSPPCSPSEPPPARGQNTGGRNLPAAEPCRRAPREPPASAATRKRGRRPDLGSAVTKLKDVTSASSI